MQVMDHGRAAIISVVLGIGLTCSLAGADQDVGPSDRKNLVDANAQFALDLYAQSSKGEENIFFSPFSISTSLAVAYAGARGNTAKEMKDVLHFDLEPARLHATVSALLGELEVPSGKKGCRLRIANGLWVEQTHGFLPEFLAIGQKDYRAELRAVDFVHAAEAQRKTINEWIDERTNGKIKDLVPEKAVSADTVLVLTNAIYFNGDWEAKFQPSLTKEATFTVAAGKTVQVPMMHQTGYPLYQEQADLQILEMPYVGKVFSMVILLPRKVDGLANLEKALSAKALREWIGGVKEQEAAVELPRFAMTTSYLLEPALRALGMRDAFSMAAADFSGMSNSGPLFVTAV